MFLDCFSNLSFVFFIMCYLTKFSFMDLRLQQHFYYFYVVVVRKWRHACFLLTTFLQYVIILKCSLVRISGNHSIERRHFEWPKELPSIDNLRCLFKVSSDVIIGRRDGCFLGFITPTNFVVKKAKPFYQIQLTPLINITLSQHCSDSNNRRFLYSFWENGTYNNWKQYTTDYVIRDPI